MEKLDSKLDEKGYLRQDVRIKDPIISLGNLKKVYGHLSIDSKFINDLGELNYVKTDFWYHEKTLKILCNLIKIGGSMNLRYSNIESLGELQRVGGDLSLRDTKIQDLGKLNYVGGNLYLPKRIEGINLDNIHERQNTFLE